MKKHYAMSNTKAMGVARNIHQHGDVSAHSRESQINRTAGLISAHTMRETAKLNDELEHLRTQLAEAQAQLAAANDALTNKLAIHSFNTTQLPDGSYVIVHPEIPPHVWNGQTFEKVYGIRQPTQDKGEL